MQLLARGWPFEKVHDRHMKYAQKLVNDGIAFRPYRQEDTEAVVTLLRSHIEGWRQWYPNDSDGIVVAVDANDDLLGAAVIQAGDFQGNLWGFLTGMAVDPSARGRGIGVVLLGILHQLSPDGRTFEGFLGGCAPDHAKYYHRAGFTVLQPHEPLPFAPAGLDNAANLMNMNDDYPCQMFRKY
jgi:GNAT superfamily N-acetyltransferase